MAEARVLSLEVVDLALFSQSVLSSISAYFLSIFRLTTKVAKILEKLTRDEGE